MKKVLGILCHPDDEVLFGWPVFQAPDIEKYLIILCDDYARKGSCRRKALEEVCKQENITLWSVTSFDNNFYTAATRPDSILNFIVDNISICIKDAIIKIKPDYIFTHNPVGEYGHGSHRLLFELVSQNDLVNNLVITDICQKSDHRSCSVLPKFIWDTFYKKLFRKNCNLNSDFYNRCKAIYDKHNAWTWSKPPFEKCNLYILKES